MGRPRGRQHDETVHVRLPGPAVAALRQLARGEGASLSALVRAAIDARLCAEIAPLAALARDEDAAATKRMKAAKTIRLIAEVALHVGPMGLRIARERAAAKAAAQTA